MKFTVERATWARGNNDGVNFLFSNHTEKRCCLGFVCKQLGFKDEELKDVANPGDLCWDAPSIKGKKVLMQEDFTHCTNTLTEEAIVINDSSPMDDKTREERLNKVFKAAGHEMVFID